MLYCCVHAISLSSNMDYCCIVFISTITLPPPSSLSLIWLIVVFMMALSLSLLSRTLSLHSPLVLSLVYCCIGACPAPSLSIMVCVATRTPSLSLSLLSHSVALSLATRRLSVRLTTSIAVTDLEA